ncbi:MAG: methylaspartate mutase subunit E, partial [Oscillospiraceae bacterium]
MSHPNNKLSMDEFRRQQKEILASWPTGKDVNFQESVDYHKAMPENKIFSKKLQNAKTNQITLVQPRAGVALVDEHIELMQFLEKEGGADLLPTTIDSYTRHNRYNECENGIAESIRQNKSLLNGFPAVNHGVAACRRVNESVSVPMQVRHGTPDARLLTEITYAGGFTSYEGGGISYNIPYSKNTSLEDTIHFWKYVDRLTGLYEEAGVSIDREPYGPLTGTLVAPCISHAVAVLEALLAAEQGVKNITVG